MRATDEPCDAPAHMAAEPLRETDHKEEWKGVREVVSRKATAYLFEVFQPTAHWFAMNPLHECHCVPSHSRIDGADLSRSALALFRQLETAVIFLKLTFECPLNGALVSPF